MVGFPNAIWFDDHDQTTPYDPTTGGPEIQCRAISEIKELQLAYKIVRLTRLWPIPPVIP